MIQNPNITFEGLTINATRDLGVDTGVKIHYSKNLDTITRSIDSTDIITRLVGHGIDGLTIEGHDVSDLTDIQLVGFHYKLKDGKKIITERYIDSQYIDNYALPKEGLKEWSDIEDQRKLLLEMQKYITRIDKPKVTYEVSFLEFAKCGIAFSDVNNGDIVTVIDDELNIIEKLRIVELNQNEDNIELSTATLAEKKTNLINWIDELDKVKDDIGNIDVSNSEIFKELQNRLEEIGNILNGKESKVIYDKDAIYVIDAETLGVDGQITNSTCLLKLAAGALGISTNGGQTYKTAVDKKGVAADQLIGQAIVGVLGRFERVTVRNTINQDVCNIGRFKSQITGQDTFGIQIEGGALEIIGGLSKDQVDEEFFDEVNKDITELENALNNIDNVINDAFSDNSFTLLEANQLKMQLNLFIAESVDIINHATTLKITAEKEAYANAIQNLKTYLETYWLIAPYPKVITQSDRQSITIKMELVASSKSILETAISKAIEESSKQFAISYVNDQMSEVNNALDSLDNKFNTMTKDLIVTAMEAETFKITLEEFKKESEDIIKEATELNIISELNQYKQSISDYENYLNNIIFNKTYPLEITESIVSEIKFLSANITKNKSILFNKIEDVKLDNMNTIIKNEIQDVNDAFKNFEENIHDVLFDGQMTKVEANLLKTQLDILEKEGLDLIPFANSLKLYTEVEVYNNALSDLKSYMNKYWFDKSYPLSISKAQQDAINTKYGALAQAKTELSNAINYKTNALTKEELEREIKEATKSLDDLKNEINNIYTDRRMDASEARMLEIRLQQVIYESMDLIKIAEDLKITTLKTNYENKIEELRRYMYDNWLGKTYPLEISEQNHLTIMEKFRQVEYAKSQLDNEIKKEYVNQNAIVVNKDYNGVNINTKDGLLIMRGDGKVRSIFNATSGISIEKKDGGSWIKQLYADTNGNLNVKNLIATNITLNGGVMKDNEGNTLIDLANKTIDFGKFKTIFGKLSAKYIDTEELYVGTDKLRGKITAGQIDIKGLTVTNNKNQTTFKIDSNGNLTLGGNIIWGYGSKPSYTADEVGALDKNYRPSYSDITGSKPDMDADNTFAELKRNDKVKGFVYQNGQLYLNLDAVKAGTLSGDKIVGGTILGTKLQTGETGIHNKYMKLEREYIDFYHGGSTKMRMGYADISGSGYQEPIITMGAGEGDGRNVMKIYKTTQGGWIEFCDKNGKDHGIEFDRDGVCRLRGKWDFSQAEIVGFTQTSNKIVFD